MEKRDRQWSRKSWSGCPLRPCSWWCLGGPSRVTKCRWTLWSVRASSWGSWLYSSSNTKYRLTMTSITDQPREASHCKTASVAVLCAPANAVETLMADQTNARTRLIEEGALLPESVPPKASPGPLSTWLVKLFEHCGGRMKTNRSVWLQRKMT
jgi:hypothetical protein